MKKGSIFLVILIGLGLSSCAGTAKKTASDKSSRENGNEKERSGLIEITGKPIFIDDYDMILTLETDKGEMEFNVAKKARILRNGMPIELGKISPKLNATVKYEAGGKNTAYKVIQTSPIDSTIN